MTSRLTTAAADPSIFRELTRIIRADDPRDMLPRAGRLAATIVGARQAATVQTSDDGDSHPHVTVWVASAGEDDATSGTTEGDAAIGRVVALGSAAERLTDE